MENKLVIAIVDDEALSNLHLTRAVMLGGMLPVSFEDPDQFLAYIGSQKPGCILLDMNMPRMSGIDVLCKLEELGITVPVIMVTGDSDVPTATAALRNGAVDFIAKPVDATDLVERIRAITNPLIAANN